MKLNGMSVIGKYLSKMKLKQFKQYGWKDSEMLQERAKQQAEIDQEMLQAQAENVRKQFENGEISQAQYRTLVDTTYQKKHEFVIPTADPVGEDNMFQEDKFLKPEQMPDFDLEMTLEQKQQMAIKWGRTYTVQEWAELEKNYREMCEAFSVKDPDTKNSLIFICKTNLKMNQAIDCGDLEGYQKLSRVYDNLRKSANLTALQNKEDKHQFLDSVGQLVAFCQKNGGSIPPYQINAPQDIVDKVIADMKEYNRSLVQGDSALARQIQDYIKEAKAAAAKKRDKAQAREKGLEAPQLSDQDILDFKEFVKQEKADTLKQTQEQYYDS